MFWCAAMLGGGFGEANCGCRRRLLTMSTAEIGGGRGTGWSSRFDVAFFHGEVMSLCGGEMGDMTRGDPALDVILAVSPSTLVGCRELTRARQHRTIEAWPAFGRVRRAALGSALHGMFVVSLWFS